MKITYLIGNGFDLNLGLKTGYKHFLEKYKKPDKEDSAAIQFFKKTIKAESDLWKDAEYAMGSVTRDFKEAGYGQEEFEECYLDFTDKLAEYLLLQEELIDESIFQNDNSWAKKFCDDIIKFNAGLTKEKRVVITQFLNNTSGGFEMSFLNYNYTRSLDRFIEYIIANNLMGTRFYKNAHFDNIMKRPYHVHGTVEADMVFAVDNEKQIACPEILTDDDFKRLFIKEKANAMFEERSEEESMALLNKSNLICIYGMSIGETDTRWWKRICNLLAEKDDLHVIVYDYSIPNTGLHKLDYLRYRRGFINNFLSYAAEEGIDEQILRLNIRKYVEDCEELVLDTAALVGTLNVLELVIPEKTRAEVISISNPDHIQQEIKKSPYWANLLGRDAKDGEAFQVFATLDEESQTAILTAMTFIGLLDQESLNINALKEMVSSETLKEWGNFEEAQLYIKNWANEGFNFRVRFSKTHNVAHVLIFDHVDSGFILQSYQVVRAYVMTLVKSPDRKYWLVHSFSNELEEQMNMREFLKYCFGKVKKHDKNGAS